MLYIISPVFNSINLLTNFISKLQSQTFKDFKLIIIDDNSTIPIENELNMNANFQIIILRHEKEKWWAGSIQTAFKFLRLSEISNDDLILISNIDVDFDQEYLQQLVLEFLSLKSESLLGTAFHLDSFVNEIMPAGVFYNFNLLKAYSSYDSRVVNCISTRGLISRWSTFQKLGNFHTVLLPHYFSDYEFTLRASAKKIKIVSSTRARLVVKSDISGYRKIETIDVINMTKKFFSKKNLNNPIFLFTFVLLSYPYHRSLKIIFKSIRLGLGRYKFELIRIYKN